MYIVYAKLFPKAKGRERILFLEKCPLNVLSKREMDSTGLKYE